MLTLHAIASGAVGGNITKQFEENSPLSITFPDQYLSVPLIFNGIDKS